ncbi:MAG: aminotransferase [Treponema sp.]|jgi:aspartate/methionine/tyrosine aminotransferase|nr:aminotransferase [Treponema sp.]
MKISAFKIEEWMNAYEESAKFNIAETCVDSVSIDELFEITGEDKAAFFNEFCSRRLTYGKIFGQEALKEGICALYRDLKPEQAVTTHGAAGANNLLFYSLINPGDRVVSLFPTYQSLYSIPEAFGADVIPFILKPENNFVPDLDELRGLVTSDTKLVCINNPDNPTGYLMPEKTLREIVEIVRGAGAYLLCDEVYRYLNQEDGYPWSVVDLYEKAISVSSMSKVFSLAGLRLGWIATKCDEVMAAIFSHRDYNTISCGMFDERLAGLALKNAGKLLARNKGIVRENLQILDEWVKREKHIRYVKPQAGTTALLYYDMKIPSVDFCTGLLKETGALLTPGSCFEQEYSCRIGYACDKQELVDGLAAVSEYLKQF